MTFTAPRRNPRALIGDQRGVAGLYFAVVISSMIVAAIAALDLIRVHLVRSRMWAASDAALLAAGQALGNANWQSVGVDYFNANMGGSYMGATVTVKTTDFVGSSSVTGGTVDTVSLSINSSVPLLSAGFLTLANVTIKASGKARRQGRIAEVAMVLDNTGSMADSNTGAKGNTKKGEEDTNSKLYAMKEAAGTLVTMLTDGDAGGKSSIGLVPFNETVRVGKSAWLKDGLTDPLASTEWNGCVYERQDNGAFTFDSTTPTEAKFTPYMETKCHSEKVNGVSKRLCGGVEETPQNGCVVAPLQFLTSDKDALEDAIKDMTASGATMVAGGLIWGWRMLDPGWRGTDASSWGSATLPQDASSKIQKVIVLLTDGDNDVWEGSAYMKNAKGDYVLDSNGKKIIENSYYSPFRDASHFTYKDPDTGDIHSDIDLVGTRDQDANDLLKHTCNAAKKDGIDIFSITFGSSVNTTTSTLMKNCATTTSYYYDASTGDELDDVFKNIGYRLSELKLIE